MKKNDTFLVLKGSGKCTFSHQIAKAKSYFCRNDMSITY